MSKIKLVIEIDEQIYNEFMKENNYEVIYDGYWVAKAIANGTPITEGDLISRSELIKTVEKGEGISWERHGKDDMCVRKKYIDNAPSVKPNCEGCTTWSKSTELLKKRLSYLERPQGEWKDYSDEGYVECPFCGSATTCDDNKDELHYCWNCGADMRGDENGKS